MSDWPHAPIHRLSKGGAFIVTAGTYRKVPVFSTPERLSLLQDTLLNLLTEAGWQPQAWAIFPNHYHFVALSSENSSPLNQVISRLHSGTALAANRKDETPGRRVWYQYWDTGLTYEKSYLARLKYVHCNAVHHGLVPVARDYLWCSASWFERRAGASFRKAVFSFKTDALNVPDDF